MPWSLPNRDPEGTAEALARWAADNRPDSFAFGIDFLARSRAPGSG